MFYYIIIPHLHAEFTRAWAYIEWEELNEVELLGNPPQFLAYNIWGFELFLYDHQNIVITILHIFIG